MRLKVPFRRYFRFAFPLHRLPRKPQIDGDLRDWPACCRLPELGEIDQEPAFAVVYAGWMPEGVGIALEVLGKTRMRVDQGKFWTGDCLEVWIDTAPAESKRQFDASCHHFYFLPRGGGRYGENGVAGRAFPPYLARPPQRHLPDVEVASLIAPDHYTLEAFLPAHVLSGWPPPIPGEVGFSYHLHDVQKGDQSFNLSKAFPIHADPSLWATGRLVE